MCSASLSSPQLNLDGGRHSMRIPAAAAVLSGVLSGFSCVAPHSAHADDTVAKPSSAEIRNLERRVNLPPKASALDAYVRYYYAWTDSGPVGRAIDGIYVAKSWFKPSEIPASDIIVVSAETDVSVPENAKCAVIFVTYTPINKTAVASCSASLILKKQQ